MTLTEFLEARIGEDEAIARKAAHDTWTQPRPSADRYATGGGCRARSSTSRPFRSQDACIAPGQAEHTARWDPARVLVECASKRAILALHGQVGHPDMPICRRCDSSGPEAQCYPCDTLSALALPYADHPDYDEAWRP